MAGTYSDETREQALAKIRDRMSLRTIEAELGVPRSTLSRWAQAAGITIDAAQVEAATNATKIAWAQRKTALVDRLGEVAAELLEKARDTSGKDAQAFVTSVAICVDKAQLLSGGVTSRHEQLGLERQRERVAAMRDELADRRDAKNGTTGG